MLQQPVAVVVLFGRLYCDRWSRLQVRQFDREVEVDPQNATLRDIGLLSSFLPEQCGTEVEVHLLGDGRELDLAVTGQCDELVSGTACQPGIIQAIELQPWDQGHREVPTSVVGPS